MLSPTRIARAFMVMNGRPHATIFSDRLKGFDSESGSVKVRSIKIWGANGALVEKLAKHFATLGYGCKVVITPYNRVRLHVWYT